MPIAQTTSLADLYARYQDVQRLASWHLQKPQYRARCMRLGGIQDVIQEMWVVIISRFSDGRCVKAGLATVVCNQAAWTLIRLENQARTLARDLGRRCELDEQNMPRLFDTVLTRLQHDELVAAVGFILRTLPKRERIIIKLRFGLVGNELTLEETGRLLHVTRERIRQLEGIAIRKMQHPRRAQLLRKYLDQKPQRQGATNGGT